MKHLPHFLQSDLENLFNSDCFQKFNRLLIQNDKVKISGFNLSSFAVFVYYLYNIEKKNIITLFSDIKEAEHFRDDLDFFFNSDRTGFLPELKSGDQEKHTSEIDSFFYNDVKNKLFDEQDYIYVVPETSLELKFPSSQSYNESRIFLKVGHKRERESLIDKIYNYGYKRVEKTTFPKDFSVRASIIDIYIPGSSYPYRIEFFGDSIDSIRTFDPETQLTREKINSFSIPPLSNSKLFSENSVGIEKLIDKKSLVLFYDTENFADNTKSHSITNFKTVFRYNVLSKGIDFPLYDITIKNKTVKGLKSFIKSKTREETSFILYSSENKQVERLQSIFNSSNVIVKNGYFSSSFFYKSTNTYFISENDVLSHSNRSGLKNKRLPSDIDVQEVDIDDVTYGDFMVHVDFGIGKFEGLERVEAFGSVNECLKLEYRKGSSIYVPLEKLKYVKKYRNSGENPPKLTKLQSGEWERKKSKTKKSAEKIVDELITLYSIRQNAEGYSFSTDDELQIEMESEFPHQETPDQIKATEEIKADMESEKPMDRLLCGDVGFGKTEVAIRAAFKAVLDNKQVAILVPTTILVDQHYSSFCERLDQYPILIEKLSRFVTGKKQKQVLEKLESGSLDIIIGTHRLLSKDITFDDLGLLIIDEEHRFGVKNKEKIKNIKKNLDVLSLTATPIPRTLQFSLIGARDFSQINTPPKYRLPIITEIIDFDDEFIKERIEFELNRSGQVYFVHNRIKTIQALTVQLRNMVPHANIDYAHGRMSEKRLEGTINSFINRDLDILVTTTIIESGIDIQNVNTMFIDKAHNFGLAQLYQLRGRVGRSNRRAFCYLIAPKMKNLQPNAVKRLQTIKRYTSLGSGYNIAMSDMEIRGAGNLFGIEQSGNIQKIGYDLYVKILQDTFQDKKDQITQAMNIDETKEKTVQEKNVKIISPYSSFIPEDFVSVEKMRLDIYKRISEATRVEKIQNIRSELQDRFGKLPTEAIKLFEITELKLIAYDANISKIIIKNDGQCELKFAKDRIIESINRILLAVKNICNKRNISYKFKPTENLGLVLNFQDQQILEQLSNFLLELTDNIEQN